MNDSEKFREVVVKFDKMYAEFRWEINMERTARVNGRSQ